MADSTHEMPPKRIQPKPSGVAATTELVERLDDLLKRYLELLDQYTQAREQLSRELSAGYIALAKANFNAPNRVRYGRDFYDERMQALRTVVIDRTIEEKDDAKFRTSIVLAADSEPTPKTEPEADANEKPASKPPPSSSSPTDPQISKYPTPPPDLPQLSKDDDTSEEEGKEDGEEEEDKEDKRKKQQRQRDPIRWFGILVPQALRSAQGSFVGAVETAVPRTLNLATEMRELEIEIGRARKAMRKSGG
ncbi:uncharacterized protein IWZ02DRAFT_484648 [Phyllosticta citriasiana]|uniref:Vacuolar ATPase assembly protein VMA22 n=1 Tax=Phyllosticta citriasiana TaxID=595635 RepID=A0ABR1KP90_9PEZI